MKWTLDEIAQWTSGKIISKVALGFDDFSTDTRKSLDGKFFVALKGDQFDAHQFLEKAIEQKAAGLLVHTWPAELKKYESQISVILVSDTLTAFQNMAHGYRKKLKAQVIGITGSNGKTTTKEFTAQITSAHRRTFYSQGSFNNHWGVPMTLLSAPLDAEVVIVEMGMNHRHEIQKLVEIADPTVVVCTMVGSAHIEFFGTRAKIAEEKQDIYLFSSENTTRVFNQDSDLTFDMMYPSAKKFPSSRMLSFSGRNDKCDVHFKIAELDLKSMKIYGSIAAVPGVATVPVFGEQNLTNLMAAANLAYAAGLTPEQIWNSLPRCQTNWGRNQFITTKSQAQILFDGYNANPDSFEALFSNMKLIKNLGKKMAVIGQMKELGDHASPAHQHVAHLAGQSGFSHIYFFGENHLDFKKGLEKSGFQGQAFTDVQFSDAVAEKWASDLGSQDIVIVKGSRGAQTERFIPFCQPLNWESKK